MTTPPPSPDAETRDLPSRFDAAAERAKAAIRAAQAECARWYAPTGGDRAPDAGERGQ
jgi:hypothetical protein